MQILELNQLIVSKESLSNIFLACPGADFLASIVRILIKYLEVFHDNSLMISSVEDCACEFISKVIQCTFDSFASPGILYHHVDILRLIFIVVFSDLSANSWEMIAADFYSALSTLFQIRDIDTCISHFSEILLVTYDSQCMANFLLSLPLVFSLITSMATQSSFQSNYERVIWETILRNSGQLTTDINKNLQFLTTNRSLLVRLGLLLSAFRCHCFPEIQLLLEQKLELYRDLSCMDFVPEDLLGSMGPFFHLLNRNEATEVSQ